LNIKIQNYQRSIQELSNFLHLMYYIDQFEWENIRDLFKSMLHDVDRIPSIKKIWYFKNSLKSTAVEVIEKIKFDVKGYQIARDQLLSHYNNPWWLLKKYIYRLFKSISIVNATVDNILNEHLTRSFTLCYEQTCDLNRPHLHICFTKTTNQKAWRRYTYVLGIFI